MVNIVHRIRHALASQAARHTFLASLLLSLPIYLVALPAPLAGGRIAWTNVSGLTAQTTFFASVMALLLALNLSLVAYLITARQQASAGLATSGALLGVLTPLLCCGLLLPNLLALLAAVSPALAGAAAGTVQAFINRYETLFLILSVGLMMVSLYRNMRHIKPA